MKMRTAENLIDELMNAPKSTRLGFAVLVEREWRFIVVDYTRPVDGMHSVVALGEEPIGMVSFVPVPVDDETSQKVLTCLTMMSPEWEDNERMTTYFENRVSDMMHDVESRYGKSMLRNANPNLFRYNVY